jgi:tRNA(fMet)-specific endonuclease VapC
MLANVSILSFDRDASADAAGLGSAIGPMDTLIAGTALAYGATLVTHNASDFRCGA